MEKIYEQSGIKCDNPTCDFNDPTVTMEQYPEYVNKPCPKCGENLLTEEDHNRSELLISVIEKMDSCKSENDVLNLMKTMNSDEIQILISLVTQIPQGTDLTDKQISIDTHNGIEIVEIKKVD